MLKKDINRGILDTFVQKVIICPGVETGRHLSLRWISPYGRGGSSPLLGTIIKSAK